LQNHLAIAIHNNEGTSSYTMSHNDFSDLSSDEFQQRFYLGKYSPGVKLSKGRSDGSILPSFTSTSRRTLRTSDETGEEIKEESVMHIDEKITTAVDAPDYKNWKEEGAVSSVKNQWVSSRLLSLQFVHNYSYAHSHLHTPITSFVALAGHTLQ